MAIRPPRKPVQRSADRVPTALNGAANIASGGDAASEGYGAGDEAAPAAADIRTQAQQSALEAVESALRPKAGDVDAEDFAFVIEHLRKAIADAPLAPTLAGPDRATWVETLEFLMQNGLIAEEEHETLIRQFGEATSALQSRDAQVALELAKRIERDGEQQAMEWLASQQSGDAEAGKAVGAIAEAVAVIGKQSITRSRSRRLRGPPRIA